MYIMNLQKCTNHMLAKARSNPRSKYTYFQKGISVYDGSLDGYEKAVVVTKFTINVFNINDSSEEGLICKN